LIKFDNGEKEALPLLMLFDFEFEKEEGKQKGRI
jgi:hypothetical protein